jgi:hypothetical protein
MDVVTDGYRIILRFNERNIELSRDEWLELREFLAARMIDTLTEAAKHWEHRR